MLFNLQLLYLQRIPSPAIVKKERCTTFFKWMVWAMVLMCFLSIPAKGWGKLLQTGKTFTVNSPGDEEDSNAGEPGDDNMCDVDPGTPGEQCTFRAAIQNHNANRLVDGNPVRNQIIFDIDLEQLGALTPTIEVGSTGNGPLPFVLGIVTIDGTTQLDPTGNPVMIELDGSQAGTFASGLELRAGGGDSHAPGEGSIIRGLVIHSFASHGIAIGGTGTPGLGGHVIEGCFIGTDLKGIVARGNGGNGIYIEDTPNNTIGGETPEQRTIISGNTGDGIRIESTFLFTEENLATGNKVLGNFIGTDVTGENTLGNAGDGLLINNASDNTIGGLRLSEGNLIGGNGGNGIKIMGQKAMNHKIQGNDIGINQRADIILPNGGDGIHMLNASNNTIGDHRDQFQVILRGNLISGNVGNGIHIEGINATNNQILGNHIGTNLIGGIIGSNPRPNEKNGIYILNASGNTIGEIITIGRNLISGNMGNGIHIEGAAAQNNLIMGNFIGTNHDGTDALGNNHDGILISNATNNTVGGIITAEVGTPPGNVISGNVGNGIQVANATANNPVEGNIIGLDAAGNAPIGNGQAGVLINEASQMTIGGPTLLALTKRNIISGNVGDGVVIQGANAKNNKILNNFIGTNIDGTITDPTPNAPNSGDELGNQGEGIHIINASGNTIGGVTLQNEGNTISGNISNGINIQGATAVDNNIRGNHIGTNGIGTQLPNGLDGIRIGAGARNTLIGGELPEQNIIAGNKQNGIQIAGPLTQDVFVFNNLIGLVPGAALIGEKLPNLAHGIFINNAPNNTIGGNFLTPGGVVKGSNIISGNQGDGIHIFGANAANNIVQLNRIGTDIPGGAEIPNLNGIMINGAPNNTIGGNPVNAGNLISGNGSNGIFIQGAGAVNNSVEGNIIGLNAALNNRLPNFDGIKINNASNNSIGIINRGNTIIGNFGNGVEVVGNNATGNPIRFNAIFANLGLGIDLQDDDVTNNDPGDPDAGPHNLQNFPVLTSAISAPFRPGNPPPIAIVTGSLNSLPNTNFTLDFYRNVNPDPSGFGEGATYVASHVVTTDESGNVSFTFGFPGIPPDLFITATAIDPNDNTSEFSNALIVEDSLQELADLELRKRVNDTTPQVGEQVTFVATLLNKGPSGATGVEVSDSASIGLNFESVTPSQGSYDANTGVWTVGNLSTGDSATLTIVAIVTQTGTLTNTAEVMASNQPDPDSAPNNGDETEDDQSSISVEVQSGPEPLADLELTKEADQTTLTVGEQVTFTIKLTNKGPDAATGIAVKDVTPVGMTFDQISESLGNYDATTGVWTINGLDSGSEAELTIVATVLQEGTFTNTAEVTASDQTDPDSTPNNEVEEEDDQSSIAVEVQETVSIEQQLLQLIAQVENLINEGELSKQQGKVLTVLLEVTIKLHRKDNAPAAVSTLRVFNLLVKILVHRGELSKVAGQELILAAENIINQLKMEALVAKNSSEKGKPIPNNEIDESINVRIHPVYPNPFTTSTTITFELVEERAVHLMIYDERGMKAVYEFRKLMPAGVHTLSWVPEHLPAGMYVLRLQAGTSTETSRILFVK